MSSSRPTVAPKPDDAAAVSPFRLALDEYLRTRSKNSKTPQFILDIRNANSHPGKGDVQKAMIKLEQETQQSTIRKVLKPVIRVLEDYSGIIDTLAQADPMPTAIIWGCLKAAVDCSKRFVDLYDNIKSQLAAMNKHLECLTEYEELFGDSENMRNLLQATYINIIRFWRRVEKECNRCIANRLSRALSSFSTSKLDSIVASIKSDADDFNKLVPIVMERLQKRERENAAEERKRAGIAREEQSIFMQHELEDLRLRKIERKNARQKDVCHWLKCGPSILNESNFRHQDQNMSLHSEGTSLWLLSNPSFQAWLNFKITESRIWLRGAPGVGKSVLCAYAIQQVKKLYPSACCAFQYYTFDDEFSALQVYRSLAEQMVERLWTSSGDMPEEIHAFTISATCSRREDVKVLIRMLLDRIDVTYIFLDGLDEECNNDERSRQLTEVLDFLESLAAECPSRIRVWCSSQERTSLQKKLEQSTIVIEVTKDLNNADIKQYLSKPIHDLSNLDLDEGYQALILEDLGNKADGCFLWASLMLNSIVGSPTLQAVQEQLNDGLPADYERYYQKKIDGISSLQKPFVSKLLACIVYAKRPLNLEELCESIAILGTSEGQNIDRRQRIFRNQVLKLCEPLIRVQEVAGDGHSICTLTHASVRKFLVKNSEVLCNADTSTACEISEKIMANVCYKYLCQPRYERLLTLRDDTLIDSEGTDIMEQHLLSYAAKYWDKHLDEVPYLTDLCERVKNFLTSAQFQTCLQVQSLFIEGQFQDWLATNRLWAGPHFKRVFPAWLTDNCGPELDKDYRFFLGEWRHLLNETTCWKGKYPGQIDRCLWGALGPRNFLSKNRSRYKSFMVSDNKVDGDNEAARRYYDGIDEAGDYLVVVELLNLASNSPELNLKCQQWSLKGRRPKLQVSQDLKTSRSSWSLYDHPVTKKVLGRPMPVSFTADLQYLRIGSQLFFKSDENLYKPLQEEKEYFEEVGSRGPYIALAARNTISREDLYIQSTEGEDINDYGDFVARILEEAIKKQDEKATESTVPTTAPNSSQTQTSQSDSSSRNTSMSSLLIEDPQDLANNAAESEKVMDVLDFDSSSDSHMSNSAATSWSEGSTELASDELEEEQWNDWGNEDEILEDPELELQEDGSSQVEAKSEHDVEDSDLEVDSQLSDDGEESEIHDLLDTGLKHEIRISGVSDLVMRPPSSSSDSLESRYSPSLDSDDTDESDSENEEAGLFEDLIFGRGDAKPSEGGRRATIRIYDNTKPHNSPPIFHFSRIVTGRLFSSPPVFHPAKKLLVWPLGNGEILFANFDANSYFTRQLCCSAYHSCFVFIKAHFSSDGEFLHFAALEAKPSNDDGIAEGDGGQKSVKLSLQVSTHRLSLRKTTRSPPRLIFQTTLALPDTDSISVSRLPYTLTWTPKKLYLSTSGQCLNVVRVPLFRVSSECKSSNICYIQNQVFLPHTVDARGIRYFPPRDREGLRPDKAARSMVILGSHSSVPAQGFLVQKHQVSPPIGFYLNEEDLGGWKCQPNTAANLRQRENQGGGRLQGKFETFNRSEDCDIVPYLF